MTARLGISVSGEAVRGVLVRAGRVVWHARSSTLDRLLGELPPMHFGRPSVRVALGLASSDLKRIDGLPATRQQKLLDRVVRENADSFFLRLGARTLVTGMERRADGSVWGAALDAGLVDAVVGVLRRRRLPPAGVMPYVVAMARAVPPGAWRVPDDGLEVALTTIEGGTIQECRRGLAGRSAAPCVAALEALGPDGQEFAAAYGAAIGPVKSPFIWRPVRDLARSRTLAIVRVAAASVLLVGATSAALLARGVHATRLARAATTELARLRDPQIAATRVDAELRRVTAELDRIHRFEAERGRVTLLVGALSEALPDSTALTSLHIDSAQVSFIALAPRAAEVLPQLIDLPEVIAPRIVGSVTREVQGVARVERASFRFRRPRERRADAR